VEAAHAGQALSIESAHPLSAVVIDEGRKGDSMRGKNRTAGRPTFKFYSIAGIPPSGACECLETVLVLVFGAAGLSRGPGLALVGPPSSSP
jgi:hypothetical protein